MILSGPNKIEKKNMEEKEKERDEEEKRRRIVTVGTFACCS